MALTALAIKSLKNQEGKPYTDYLDGNGLKVRVTRAGLTGNRSGISSPSSVVHNHQGRMIRLFFRLFNARKVQVFVLLVLLATGVHKVQKMAFGVLVRF